MKKIRLDLDALAVDSFPTVDEGAGEGGTVHGNQLSVGGSCLGQLTCASACSMTDGVRACKTCGPCCYE